MPYIGSLIPRQSCPQDQLSLHSGNEGVRAWESLLGVMFMVSSMFTKSQKHSTFE